LVGAQQIVAIDFFAVSGPTNKAMERIQEDAWEKLWDEAIREVWKICVF